MADTHGAQTTDVLGIMDVATDHVAATATSECAIDLTVVTMDVATDSRSVHANHNISQVVHKTRLATRTIVNRVRLAHVAAAHALQ